MPQACTSAITATGNDSGSSASMSAATPTNGTVWASVLSVHSCSRRRSRAGSSRGRHGTAAVSGRTGAVALTRRRSAAAASPGVHSASVVCPVWSMRTRRAIAPWYARRARPDAGSAAVGRDDLAGQLGAGVQQHGLQLLGDGVRVGSHAVERDQHLLRGLRARQLAERGAEVGFGALPLDDAVAVGERLADLLGGRPPVAVLLDPVREPLAREVLQLLQVVRAEVDAQGAVAQLGVAAVEVLQPAGERLVHALEQ